MNSTYDASQCKRCICIHLNVLPLYMMTSFRARVCVAIRRWSRGIKVVVIHPPDSIASKTQPSVVIFHPLYGIKKKKSIKLHFQKNCALEHISTWLQNNQKCHQGAIQIVWRLENIQMGSKKNDFFCLFPVTFTHIFFWNKIPYATPEGRGLSPLRRAEHTRPRCSSCG